MNNDSKQKKHTQTLKVTKISIMFFTIFVIFIIYCFVEPFLLTTKTDNIKSKDLPLDFAGTKIVFASDIHHGIFFSRERVSNMVNKINALNPDIVLLGGDYVSLSPKYIKPCFEELAKLKSRFGIFAVLGNHDHWEGAFAVRTVMTESNIRAIDNKYEFVTKNDSRIRICGIADPEEHFCDTNSALEGASKEDFVIFLSHRPDFIETVDPYYSEKIDLMLSGHTHGGQFTFFGLWAPKVPSAYGQKYRTGLIQKDNTKVLVSNGVGTTALPVRFFARPQINLVYLWKQQ